MDYNLSKYNKHNSHEHTDRKTHTHIDMHTLTNTRPLDMQVC